MRHLAGKVLRDLFTLPQNSSHSLGVNFIELSIRRATIDFIFDIYIKQFQANLPSKFSLRNDLEISSCSLKELLDDVNDTKTIFIVYDNLDIVFREHLETITTQCDILWHCNCVQFSVGKVTASQSNDIVTIDSIAFCALSIEAKL